MTINSFTEARRPRRPVKQQLEYQRPEYQRPNLIIPDVPPVPRCSRRLHGTGDW